MGKKWAVEGFLPDEPRGSIDAFAIGKKIYEKKSKYQTIEIIENEEFGRILFLNGLIQLAARDEAVYHEMLVHTALLAHPNPKRVLIIGGGDGGALREVLKHPVKEVVHVDIDEEVIIAAKKYLPSVTQGAFNDPRTKVVIADGQKLLSEYKEYFDCIILDSNDPDGVMAADLFSRPFFLKVKAALKPDGMFVAQTGYVSDKFGKKARKDMEKIFSHVKMHRAFVRNFSANEHSFSVATSRKDYACLTKSILETRYKKRKLKMVYYSSSIHFASLVHPAFLERELK